MSGGARPAFAYIIRAACLPWSPQQTAGWGESSGCPRRCGWHPPSEEGTRPAQNTGAVLEYRWGLRVAGAGRLLPLTPVAFMGRLLCAERCVAVEAPVSVWVPPKADPEVRSKGRRWFVQKHT